MPSFTWLNGPLKKIFPYRRHLARLARIPFVAALVDKTLLNGSDLVTLPKDRVVIQQAIDPPESIILPSRLVDHFIEQAGQRWIMNYCICREAEKCRDYPRDLGCIFLGDAVLKISPKVGRLVSKEEALAHARRAREMGLVQVIGRERIDYFWLGARPFDKFLTICNCCPCCCLWRMIPDLDPGNRSKIRRLPGVQVWVDSSQCGGCGRCTRQVCFADAIQVRDGKAWISAECRGCGRCVEICPKQAIHLSVENNGYIKAQIERISRSVDVSG